jgi:hypothetical protein
MVIKNAGSEPGKVPGLVTTIVSAALLVGTLDALGATINYLVSGRKDAGKLFQYIASAVFGANAYTGGTAMIILGVLFHYIVASLFTLCFFLLYPRMKLLSVNRFVTGILYGIFIWLVMTFLVVPLTRIPAKTVYLKPAIIGASILIVAIGIPLSYIAKAYYSKRAAT